MSGTFAGTYTTQVSLSGPGDIPATITSGSVLNAGLYAPAYPMAWTVTNAGQILGAGLTLQSLGTLGNDGLIADPGASGVYLYAGGNIFNRADGTISGYYGITGAQALGGVGLTLVNRGFITSTATGQYGSDVFLGAGGYVFNKGSGVISGYTGVVAAAYATVGNSATISGSMTGSLANGVDLEDGGFLLNQPNAVISAYDAVVATGIVLRGSGIGLTMVNAGTILGNTTATGGFGIDFPEDGHLTNQATGTVSGFQGVFGASNAYVLNAGSIAGNSGTLGGVGAYFGNTGYLRNQGGGSISGYLGVSGGLDSTLVNDGGITGNSTGKEGAGVFLLFGGTVTNAVSASIGGFDGIYALNPLYLTNAGQVAGNESVSGAAGVYVGAAGSVYNLAGGAITGFDGISGGDGGALTVVNSGIISGSAAAILFPAGYANLLVIDPGASFAGSVNGGNMIGATAASTIDLVSAATAGTITAGTIGGLGIEFIDFSQINVGNGAPWTLTAANTLAAGTTLTNAGTLTIANGKLSDAGTVVNNGIILAGSTASSFASLTGTGTVTLQAAGALTLTGAVASTETIAFATAAGTLTLNHTGFSGQIDGFTIGDTISLSGVSDATTAAIVNGNTLQIHRSSHSSIDLKLDVNRSFSGDTFAVTPNGNVTETPCFLRGTLIRAAQGDIPVEALRPGDTIITANGRARPIAWIGLGRVMIQRGRRCEATPVLIAKGALAPNIPYTDLRVTKGHAIHLDGVLIPAEFLVNHRSIRWDDHARVVEFYHIELPTHDILLANGAPAESYRNDGNRLLFQNANPHWTPLKEPSCLPVLTGGPIVDATWRRLLERAGPRPGLPLTGDADPHLLIDGHRLDPIDRSPTHCRFRLHRRPDAARLISRTGVPAELGLARDPRALGIAVRQLVVWGGRQVRTLELSHTGDLPGFHAFEPDRSIRWTTGDTPLPGGLFAARDGSSDIDLRLGGQTSYPNTSEAREDAA